MPTSTTATSTTIAATSTGSALRERHVLYRTTDEIPPTAVSAKGLYITLSDGNQILDAVGGAAVSCLGHSHPDVIAYMTKCLQEELVYAYSLHYTTKPAEELANLLLGHKPGGLCKAHFVSSGSEAMEAALKIARQYHVESGQSQRTKFIARHQSYHGNTLGALAIGGHWPRRAPFEPILSNAMSHVMPCYPYRYKNDGESDDEYVTRLLDNLEQEFQRLGPQNVAAFVMELVVGNAAGCTTTLPGYVAGVRKICDKHGALLIFDEVMCGMGRTGYLHAWQYEGIPPDIQTVGKALGGGYQPIAAVFINERVIAGLIKTKTFNSGHTYQAHPLVCAASLAVQRIIARDNLLDNVQKMGALLEAELRSALKDCPIVGEIRGRGLFWGIELVADRQTKKVIPKEANVPSLITDQGVHNGVALLAAGGTVDGVNGHHVIISPPYIITADDVSKIVKLVKDTFSAATDSLQKSGYI